MIKMLYKFPRKYSTSGTNSKKYFDSQGNIKKIKDIPFVSFKDTMLLKYGVYYQEALSLADFLAPMLRIIPEERGSAWEALRHQWLKAKSTEFFDR